MAQNVLLGLQIFHGFCNVCIMLAIFKAFLLKPHNSLEERITSLEVKVDEMQNSLYQGNDRFRDQKAMNEVFINCMLAFIDFEIAYCQNTEYEHSEDLMRAKSILQNYLARK